MLKTSSMVYKSLIVGVIVLFICVGIQPGITAYDFNNDKLELQSDTLVDAITQIVNHGKIQEIKTTITVTEAEKLKLSLVDLHNALKQGDKDEIQLAYKKIENKKILGKDFIKIISKYQQVLNSDHSYGALSLAKANSSLKFPTYEVVWVITSIFPPPFRGFFFLTNMLKIIINALLPFFQIFSLIEMLIIDEGSCYSLGVKGSWNASSDLNDDPFGVALMGYTGIFILIDFDLQDEEYPYEFLFACGFSVAAIYVPVIPYMERWT